MRRRQELYESQYCKFLLCSIRKKTGKAPEGLWLSGGVFFFLIQPSLKQLEWCFVLILISSNHQFPISKRKKKKINLKNIFGHCGH